MAAVVPKLSGLNCPSCGASLEMRTFGHALSVVCPNCQSVLDAKDPNLRILQQAQDREKVTLLIPLGARGRFGEIQYEVIGFQVRSVAEEDSSYSWQEYLLFNPYHGFRYLTEFNGHWNFVRTVQALPESLSATRVRFDGELYASHSGSETARTTYVIGEFPWRIEVGETANVTDYVHPPRLLSAETTEVETVWSLGEYRTGAEVWKAFGLEGTPPLTYGVFENQPSPYSSAGIWKTALGLLAAACLLAVLLSVSAQRRVVYSQDWRIQSPFAVTPAFDVPGHDSNLEIQTRNHGASIYVRYAVVNEASGRAVEFGREIGAQDTALLSGIHSGRYYLRADPDHVPTVLEVTVRRDVPSYSFFLIVFVLLLVPPAFQTWRQMSFEQRRWQ